MFGCSGGEARRRRTGVLQSGDRGAADSRCALVPRPSRQYFRTFTPRRRWYDQSRCGEGTTGCCLSRLSSLRLDDFDVPMPNHFVHLCSAVCQLPSADHSRPRSRCESGRRVTAKTNLRYVGSEGASRFRFKSVVCFRKSSDKICLDKRASIFAFPCRARRSAE